MARRDLTGAVDFKVLETYTGGDAAVGEEVLSLFREQAQVWSRLLDPESAGWGETQTRVHMERLVRAEYLFRKREGNTMVYGLVPIPMGTVAVSRGEMPNSRGKSRISRGGRGGSTREFFSNDNNALNRSRGLGGGALTGEDDKSASYP